MKMTSLPVSVGPVFHIELPDKRYKSGNGT